MPNTYTWTRLDLESSSDFDEMDGVITHIVCGMTVKDELTGWTCYMDSRRELLPPDVDNFIPLDEITVEWKESVAESLTEELRFRERMDLNMTKFAGKPKFNVNSITPSADL